VSSCRRALAALFGLLLLAGCGGLPQPHRGNPGGAAPQLVIPLAVRLAMLPPEAALLPAREARRYAETLADTLQAGEVPALVTDAPAPLDWRLVITAETRGGTVVPRYAIANADGRPQGATEGAPVPARAWAEGRPEALDAAARDGAARISQLLLTIRAARANATPDAISGGPSRVRLVPVRGAPGDGNTALSARMREFLTGLGYVVQDVGDGASFAVTADVTVTAGTPRNDRVEIQWIVSRRDGQELGRVVQINEVPSGILQRFWGDVAYAAAQEAAGGVQQVIRNASAGAAPASSAPR
jgi:hypothetical protein